MGYVVGVAAVLIMTMVVRVVLIWIPYHRGKMHVSLTYAGFFGFFLCLPLVFLPEFQAYYIPMEIVFFVSTMVGMAGCLAYGVNPIYTKYVPGQKQGLLFQIEEEEDDNKEWAIDDIIQEESKSLKIINDQLKELKDKMHVYRNVSVKFKGSKENFLFILLTKKGIFHIYHCNWGGPVEFKNSGAIRKYKTPKDTKDFTIATAYRQELLKKILASIGHRLPIEPIVCVTNPTIKIKGKPTSYRVIQAEDLVEYIESKEGKSLPSGEMFDLKNTIDATIEK